MELKQKYNEIIGSDTFKEFKKEHPLAFLSYVFYVEPEEILEFGFFDPEHVQIGIFSDSRYRIEKHLVSDNKNEELKKEELVFSNILEKTIQRIEEKYKSEVVKRICILSKHNGEAEWRYTFLLKNMKTLFIVCDLEGNVKKEEEIKLFSFG